MTYTIESISRGFKERLRIKEFKTSDAMYKFLNTGSNALKWKESNKKLSKGIYAYAGGTWHNIKSLDASILAHI